jgi:P27 family predicted phage terminase small subunit
MKKQGGYQMPHKSKAANSNADVPFEPNLSKPPNWLSESQKAGWSYAIDRAPKGLLKQIDSTMLAIWVVAESVHRDASALLAAEGLTVTSVNGYQIQSPYLPIINRQAVLMIKASSALGFNPASREKLDIQPEHDPNNPWAKFT